MFKCYEVWKGDRQDAIHYMKDNYPEIEPTYYNGQIEWCAFGSVVATFYKGTLNLYF